AALGVFDSRISRHQAKTVTIGVDHDGNEVRILEGRRCAVVGRLVEAPIRRPELPQQLAELMAIEFETCAPAFTMEVVLIPVAKLALRRCGPARPRNVLDVVTSP